MFQTTNRSSLRPKTLMSRQHSFISLVVVAWDSRSLFSKMIWIKQTTVLAARFGEWRGTAVQRSHLAGFGQKIHGVFRLQESCDCETVEECQIAIDVSLRLEQNGSYSSNVYFWKTEWEFLTALASLVWLRSIFETIKHQTCIPLVSWRGSALLLFWPGRPPPWKHV